VNSKKKVVTYRIECAKCGKTDFIAFVPDGSRNYYCSDCLKNFNLDKKRGKVRQSFDRKKQIQIYEFICDICEKSLRIKTEPTKENNKIICPDCYDKIKQEQRKEKRKNIKIAR